MRFYIIQCCIFLTMLLVSKSSFTQQTTKKDMEHFSYGKASINFLSNTVYLGRAYDTAVAYTTAMVGYYHKSGLFINGSASYASSKSYSGVDLYTLEGGYEFISQNEKLAASATFDKYFYNTGSKAVKSAITSSLYANVDYDFGIVFLAASAGANFADKTDFALSAGTGHNFYSADAKLSISPSFYMNAGSQHFYTGFRKRKKRNSPGSQMPIIQEVSRLKVLSYEFSLPATYETGKFSFSFTPYYSVPVNPVVYPNAPFLSEKLKNLFYIEVEVGIKF